MNIHEDKWLITGAAGFIGSHIVASLLQKGIKVVGLDNFSTGDQSRLDSALAKVDMKFQNNFEFVKADILDEMMLRKVTAGIRYISHQAALVSAPDSISKPMEYLDVNLKGFISVAMAAIANKVKRIVYASSSSVYGSNISCPLKEDDPTYPLTPYATTKKACEDFAYTFAGNSETSFVGLRYFNVFGPEQNIGGGYGAVIPSWIVKAISNKIPEIYGDPNSTRD
ncbi:MAG: NAD-dependent epimerase/dehydratase family protein, partial [Nitrospinota bacterium]